MTTKNTAPLAPLWTPSLERMQNSNMYAFMQFLQSKGLMIEDYWTLHQWSVECREDFWTALIMFCGVNFQSRWQEVLVHGDKMDDGISHTSAKWFVGGELNFAENLLRIRDDKTALIFVGEDGREEKISYNQLYIQVAQVASAMRNEGVVKGDRIAALMPNCIETVVTMLAAASIGAIFSSCSPDFGSQGVLDRFGQIKPKLLIASNAYLYAGKTLDMSSQVAAIAQQLKPDGLQKVITVDFVKGTDSEGIGAENNIADAVTWAEFKDASATEIVFEALSFDHPLYIMYSSGTTGVPKCIVHGAGGTLLQHVKEHVLHTDVKADDTIFYYTTCGWMMWNWLVSALYTGASVVLFDGSPFHPSADVLWQMAEKYQVTLFGTSAKYISALEKAGVKPNKSYQLKIRSLMSTGSPLAHESFDYVYRDIGDDIALTSISGGTDIISCFALGSPLLPVYRGQLQCPGLAMAVDVWGDDGKSVRGALGEVKGELVCSEAFPSMPVAFWNDEKGEKYHDAYFAQFDNIWAHGDYAEMTPQGGLIIHGRSDAVLNPGGVRIGTAEIYRQVEKMPEVVEGLAIGQEWQDDVRVLLFVVLAEGLELDDGSDKKGLLQSIRNQIRTHCTPRHVPAKVIQVAELPRTISGKIVELAVRNVVHNRPVKNTDALKNPQALDLFKDLEALKN